MNGAHDLGGMHGLGPVSSPLSDDEPVFHHEWEARVFALTLACDFLGHWNIDMSRHACERQHPVDYLSHSYYENWLAGLETLLTESELLSSAQDATAISAEQVDALVFSRDTMHVPMKDPPRYQTGEMVKLHNEHPLGHTRVPGYIRGRTGTVIACHGGHVFPDLNAHGRRSGAHLYTVSFRADELWGENGDPNSRIQVDLWEPCLMPVKESQT